MGKPIEAKVVTLTFIRDDKSRIWLQRRQNTGFQDGAFDVPSGKVDEGESILTAAKREVFEECDVRVKKRDLEQFYSYLSMFENDAPYVGLVFRALRWRGTPINKEPEKCSESGFYDLETAKTMPLTPMVRESLSRIATTGRIEVDYFVT